MGVDDGTARWAVQRRLEFIDFRLFWSGRLNRSDLSQTFGVSAAQASADIARYDELASSSLEYDRTSKTYRRSPNFAPSLGRVAIEEHLLRIVAIEGGELDARRTWFDAPPPMEIATLGHPGVDPLALMRLLDAVRDGGEVEVRCARATDQADGGVRISPHAIFHCAGRWYARSWSGDHGEFRDQVIHGVQATASASRAEIDASLDFEWVHRIDLVIVPNPGLPPDRRAALAAEHVMKDGRLVRPCRLSVARLLAVGHNLDLEPGLLEAERQPLVLLNRDEVERARAAMRQLGREAVARHRAQALRSV